MVGKLDFKTCRHYSTSHAKGGYNVRSYVAASVIVTLAALPFQGQVKEPGGRVIANKMETPRYGVPLARLSGVSAEVTLRLQVRKSGDVISVEVVGAHADCGFLSGCDTSARKGWEDGFAEAATQAAKISRFSCSKCEGPTFDHLVTYQFQYPPVPKEACTDSAAPPPPPSTVDSPSHVTVRPQGWPCVQP